MSAAKPTRLELDLDAQRAEVLTIQDNIVPHLIIDSLKFPIPKVEPFELRNVAAIAGAAYWGLLRMPFNTRVFDQLSDKVSFSGRLAEAIEDERAHPHPHVDGEPTNLEQYLTIRHQLEGAGSQKRRDLYARFIDYKNFQEFIEILGQVDEICKAAGAFDLAALAHPSQYFDLRVKGSPNLRALIASFNAPSKPIFSELAPWWLDAFEASRTVGHLDFWMEPYKSWLLLFRRLDAEHLEIEMIGAISQVDAPFTARHVAPQADADDWAVFCTIARQRLGTGTLGQKQ